MSSITEEYLHKQMTDFNSYYFSSSVEQTLQNTYVLKAVTDVLNFSSTRPLYVRHRSVSMMHGRVAEVFGISSTQIAAISSKFTKLGQWHV